MRFTVPIVLSVLLAAAFVASPVLGESDTADSWPQWRGPTADGAAPATSNPPLSWSETENVKWKVELLGLGHASPIVWEDRVYVLSAVEAPDGNLSFDVMAYGREDGALIWRKTARTAPPNEGLHQTNTHASGSAVTDGEHLYAHFGTHGLYCYDLEGNLAWEVDLGDMKTRNAFGEGSSPALHGNTLVVPWDHEGDSFVVALDKRTGKEVWRKSRDEQTNWATPLVVAVDGGHQVIVTATNRIRSYDLKSGEQVWELGGMTVNPIPSPVAANGVAFITSGFRGSALKAVRLSGAKGDLSGTPQVLWEYDRDTPYVPSPLLYDGYLYVVKSNNGILSCLDASSGEVKFGPERLGEIRSIYASPVGAAGRVYVTGREGRTVVLKAGPTHEVLATNVLDDGFDASMAVAGDEIYLRGRDALYCLAKE
jgi:outer membrane protein assembly factor BamB